MIRKINIWQELDWVTVILYAVLVLFGWINIYAAVYDEQHQSILDFNQRYGKQLVWIAAAVIIALATLLIDSRFYFYFSYLLYGLTLLLLIAVVLFGKEVNGARSWFYIGGLQIQPSEFSKVATCLALARRLSSHPIKLTSFVEMIKSLTVPGLIIFLPMILVGMQPDWGSALVYAVLMLVLYREGLPGQYLVIGVLFGVVFIFSLLWNETPEKLVVMLFLFSLAAWAFFYRSLRGVFIILTTYGAIYLAGIIFFHYGHWHFSAYYHHLVCITAALIAMFAMSWKKRRNDVAWIAVMLAVYLLSGYGVMYGFQHVLKPHQRTRIEIFLGQKYDPKKEGYNIEQSKIAIGSGGFHGKGFLKGTQTKFNFVPEQSTDFIFCTVGEEWGFIGSFVLLMMYLTLMLRLLYLCERQRSLFSRIYGYGVVSVFFIHVTVNIGMTIGLFPVIGIPLPFFSYGGSSLWAFTFLLFVFLRLDASRMELFR